MKNLKTSLLILLLFSFVKPLYAAETEPVAPTAATVEPPETPAAANTTAAPDTTNWTDCDIAQNQIRSIQEKIFKMKTNQQEDNSKSYLDLLRSRDQLNSRKVMVETLIALWDQYNGYLEDSAEYATTPEQTRKSIQGLTDLKSLISNNEQSVQKYQLMTDVFKVIDPKTIQGENAEENFNLLKGKLQEVCANGNEHLMFCEMDRNSRKSGINIWDTIQPGTPPPASASGRQAMLHKFLETSSAALGYETFGWWKNLSSMFVDNEQLKYDLIGKGNLSQSVVSTLDLVIAECRKQALFTDKDVNCMEQDISKIVPATNNYDYVGHIRKHLGQDVINAKDLMDKYLANSQAVTSAHEEITGGTIDRFKQLAARRSEISHNLNLSGEIMSKDAHQARENLTKAAAVEVAKLSRSLNALQRNKMLYSQYDKAVENQERSLSVGGQASKELLSIIQVFNPSSDIDNFFHNAGEKGEGLETQTILGFQPEKLFQLLKDSKINKEKLIGLLLDSPDMGKGLNSQIADIDHKLAEFKAIPEFNILQSLKNFAWKKAGEKCIGSQRNRARQIDNSQCIQEESFTEVDKLLTVGGKILSYQNDLESDLDLNALQDNCEQLRKNNSTTYEGYKKMCNEVEDMRKEIAARQEYFSKDQVRERARVSTGNRDGRKFYRYKKKTWAEIMPGALRLAMPAGMQLGKTWVQTNSIKSQMLGITTHAKAQNRWLEQQYHQGVSICNTTMSCYFNAQYQAFLPTYGNGIGNFGSGVFTSNSTFLAQ